MLVQGLKRERLPGVEARGCPGSRLPRLKYKPGAVLSFLFIAKNAYKAAIARLNVEETNYEGIAKPSCYPRLTKGGICQAVTRDQGWHLPEDLRQAVIQG